MFKKYKHKQECNEKQRIKQLESAIWNMRISKGMLEKTIEKLEIRVKQLQVYEKIVNDICKNISDTIVDYYKKMLQEKSDNTK